MVKDAALAGIAFTPAAAFTVAPGHAPNMVRIGLADFRLADATAILEQIAAIIAKGDPLTG